MPTVFPPALKFGDTIALVCPASTPDRGAIQRARQRLEERGYGVKTYGDLYRQHGYLAGSDRQRADELMAAWADPDVAAVLPARGGYGMTRILDRLDFQVLAEQPKILAGFSDITALHLAVQRKVGLVTFHSPHPQDGLGRPEGLDPLTARTYWRALTGGDRPQEGYVLYAGSAEATPHAPLRSVRSGVAEGPLTGGNLSLLAALMGTPFEVQTAGRILFLEDTGEPPYRLDRLFSQLQLAGKLTRLSGVILGHFTDCDPPANRRSLTLREVVDHYFTPLGVPVLAGFPGGHAQPNVTLPLGARVRLDVEAGSLEVLENPVRRAPLTGTS